MATLQIRCFGVPGASIEAVGELRFPTVKSLELLIYAALTPNALLPRSTAAAALRIDQSESTARRAISTDLWRLRKAFTDHGIDSDMYLVTTSRDIGIREDADIELDVRLFETRYDQLSSVSAENLTESQANRLVEIFELYTEDALLNMDHDWCFVLRERLGSKYTELIDKLLQYELYRDNWAAAIVWARKLIELDPLLEHAHRALMQSHFLTGNRGLAIRQYSSCVEVLQKELATEPSDETKRMYRGLLSVRLSSSSPDLPTENFTLAPSPITRQDSNSRPITDQLSMALGNINQARTLVENVDRVLRKKP